MLLGSVRRSIYIVMEQITEANRSQCMAACAITKDAIGIRMLLHDFDILYIAFISLTSICKR